MIGAELELLFNNRLVVVTELRPVKGDKTRTARFNLCFLDVTEVQIQQIADKVRSIINAESGRKNQTNDTGPDFRL